MNVGELFVTLGANIDDNFNKKSAGFVGILGKIKDKALQLRAIVLEKSGFAHLATDFNKASKEATGLTGFFMRLVTGANLARVAILGAGAAIGKLVMNAAEASEHLFKFSLNTGMDTTSLQRWQQQAGAAGVQAEEVANSFKDLQRKSLEIQLGQNEGAAQAFRLSGVDWTADAEKMMTQAQTMLKGRPAALGTKLAMDMGLSEEMVTFLRLRDSLKPSDENLILSKDEIAELKDFNISFTSSVNSMKMALIKLGAIIAPVMKPIFTLFARIMQATSEFTSWLSGLGKWKGYILGIASAIAVAVTAFFFPVTATVLMIAAIIAGVLLLIDDVATFMRGGDSLTGRIVAGWKQSLNDFFGWFGENWKYIAGYIGDELINAMKTVWQYWQSFVDWIWNNWKYLIGYMGEELSGLWKGIKDFLGFGGDDKKPTSEKPDMKNGTNSYGSDKPQMKNEPNPYAPMTPTLNAPKGATGGGNTTANNAVNQSVNIAINGANDPRNVANEVALRLKQQTSNAVHQLPRSE